MNTSAAESPRFLLSNLHLYILRNLDHFINSSNLSTQYFLRSAFSSHSIISVPNQDCFRGTLPNLRKFRLLKPHFSATNLPATGADFAGFALLSCNFTYRVVLPILLELWLRILPQPSPILPCFSLSEATGVGDLGFVVWSHHGGNMQIKAMTWAKINGNIDMVYELADISTQALKSISLWMIMRWMENIMIKLGLLTELHVLRFMKKYCTRLENSTFAFFGTHARRDHTGM